MTIGNSPTCCIIGGTSLLIKCATLLHHKNWHITFIYSRDKLVINWCIENNIKHVSQKNELQYHLTHHSFDYLFSIVNPIILESNLLETPKKLAINYHDSLLPKYAGMYATFWAVYNSEKQHGITWHIMDNKLDNGPVLIQKSVYISNNDTTISLNMKCYEAAISEFKTLIEQLNEDFFQTKPQQENERTYNAKFKRPPFACTLNFNQNACQILQQWNAFQFGERYENPIGTAKMVINNQFYHVTAIQCTNQKSSQNINTIAKIEHDWLYINSIDKVVKIQISPFQPNEPFEIDINATINSSNILNDALTKSYTNCIKQENYWKNLISTINYLSFPFIYETKNTSHTQTIKVSGKDAKIESAFNSKNQITAFFLLFLGRLSTQYQFDIPIIDTKNQFTNLNFPIKPLRLKLDESQSILLNLSIIAEQLEKINQKKTILSDIYERYPTLIKDEVLSINNFDFSISIDEINLKPNGWHANFSTENQNIELHFPSNEFNVKMAEYLLQLFQNFIHNIDVSDTIKSTSLLSEIEIQSINNFHKNNKIEIPETTCIHELFEEFAIKQPNEIALVKENKSITYEALNLQSNALASDLAGKNLQNQKIGILLPRSIQHIKAMLAILKSGNCYVPFSLDFPQERLQYIIDDCAINYVISNHQLSNQYQFKNISYIDVDAHETSQNHLPKVKSSNLAYVIYTSGSSGNPKGVTISHLNVVNFLFSIRSYLNPKKKRMGAVTAPFNFDVSVEEIFSTICFGGTAHIIPKSLLMQPKKLVQYLFTNKINTIFITPMLLPKIAEAFTAETIQYLKYLLSGVQAKKNGIFKPFKSLSPDLKIINTYGPTEVTFGPTAYTYNGNEDDNKNTPIGKALPNYHLYVLDKHLHFTPKYLIGELFIGGKSVSEGYLNLPTINQTKFIELPFGNNEKTYASGDFVYVDEHDNIHFVARKDNQVKIRGYRIELGEIENALNQHPLIENVIIQTATIQAKNPQIVAYIKFKGKKVTTDLLQTFLKDKIPSYCIPSYFIPINDIPLYESGKINYKLLPKIQITNTSETIEKPKNETEKTILDIWQTVLNIDSISTKDNFFKIGGDSLSAVEIIAQLHQKGFKNISLPMIYNFQTIERFANSLDQKDINLANNPLSLLREGKNEQPLFFVHGLNGSIAVMQHIINNIETTQSIYALQASNNYQQLNSLQEIAQSYVSKIENMQVKNCVLCGFSFGGILAFEMTRQLKEKGIKTTLIQFDSKPIIIFKSQRKIWYNLLYSTKVLQWLATDINSISEKISTLFNRLKTSKSIAPNSKSLNIYQKTLVKSRALVHEYKCDKQNIDIILFKATLQKKGFIGFTFKNNGWKNFTRGKITIIPIAIHHYDFDKPQFSKEIALSIQKYLIDYQ